MTAQFTKRVEGSTQVDDAGHRPEYRDQETQTPLSIDPKQKFLTLKLKIKPRNQGTQTSMSFGALSRHVDKLRGQGTMQRMEQDAGPRNPSLSTMQRGQKLHRTESSSPGRQGSALSREKIEPAASQPPKQEPRRESARIAERKRKAAEHNGGASKIPTLGSLQKGVRKHRAPGSSSWSTSTEGKARRRGKRRLQRSPNSRTSMVGSRNSFRLAERLAQEEGRLSIGSGSSSVLSKSLPRSHVVGSANSFRLAKQLAQEEGRLKSGSSSRPILFNVLMQSQHHINPRSNEAGAGGLGQTHGWTDSAALQRAAFLRGH